MGPGLCRDDDCGCSLHKTFNVVLAKARTHYPERQLLRDARATTHFHNTTLWLWVPAFAGTTIVCAVSFADTARSMRPCQAERHYLFQRRLHRRRREQRQCVDRHRAVVMGAADGVLQRAMLGHQPGGVVEIVGADLAALQRADPELAL